jgi:hypothetical protein
MVTGQEVLEEEKRSYDAHQKEREVLFANESFAIGMLQVVAGGSLFAGLAQTSAIITLVGQLPFLGFLSLMGVALVGAVAAAWFKHQYIMFKVVSEGPSHLRHHGVSQLYDHSNWNMTAMRLSMLLSVMCFGVGIVGLLAFSWVHALQPTPFDSTPQGGGYIHPRA